MATMDDINLSGGARRQARRKSQNLTDVGPLPSQNLRVVASPTGSSMVPNRNTGLSALERGLQALAPGVNAYIENAEKKKQEEDILNAEAAAQLLEDYRPNYALLEQQARMFATDEARQKFLQTVGYNQGQARVRDIQAEWGQLSDEEKASTDMAAWLMERTKADIQTSNFNPYFAKGFRTATSNGRQNLIANQLKVQTEQANAVIREEVKTALRTAVDAGDLETLIELRENVKDNVGLRETKEMLLESMMDLAEEGRIEELTSMLSWDIGTGISLGNDKSVAGDIEEIMRKANTVNEAIVAEQQAAAEAAQEEAINLALNQAFLDISSPDPEVRARGMLNARRIVANNASFLSPSEVRSTLNFGDDDVKTASASLLNNVRSVVFGWEGTDRALYEEVSAYMDVLTPEDFSSAQKMVEKRINENRTERGRRKAEFINNEFRVFVVPEQFAFPDRQADILLHSQLVQQARDLYDEMGAEESELKFIEWRKVVKEISAEALENKGINKYTQNSTKDDPDAKAARLKAKGLYNEGQQSAAVDILLEQGMSPAQIAEFLGGSGGG